MKPLIRWGKDTPGHQALRRGRYSESHRAYFLTTRTYKEEPFLIGEIAKLAAESLLRWQILCRFPLLAFVVMPNHVHVLGILTTSEPLGKVFGRWKNWSAREANKALNREGKFWQSAFYDHAVRRDEHLLDIAAYIEANPVRAGLVESPEEFPYSSAFPPYVEQLLGWRWLTGENVFDPEG